MTEKQNDKIAELFGDAMAFAKVTGLGFKLEILSPVVGTVSELMMSPATPTPITLKQPLADFRPVAPTDPTSYFK